VGNLKLRQANGSLTPADLTTVNDTLATNGRPAVDSTAPSAQPSGAVQAPLQVAPATTPVVPPVVTPPFNPQAPAMPVPPPPPLIVVPPSR
jgi:outer membrane protein